MTTAFLKTSLALWVRRLAYRRNKLTYWRKKAHSGAGAAKANVVTKEEAHVIHKWENLVNEAERNIERRRKQIAAKKPKASVRDRCLAHARTYAGHVKESPAGSNGGGLITTWESRLGFGRVPWCGVFAANMLNYVGVKNVTSRLAAVALIEQDAKAKRYCFRGWTTNPGSVMRGDLVVLFGYGVHVEIVDYIKNGVVYTVGGNTSAGAGGSQANGGGVYRRARSMSVVRGFALVNFPG